MLGRPQNCGRNTVTQFCIFVSAGDRHSIFSWLPERSTRNWDLIAVYYGDDDREFERLSAISKHAIRHKGGKFQNLRHALATVPHLLDGYDHVWVCDDDMRIRPDQIDEMFCIAAQFEFWICQPAHSDLGKISHEITRVCDERSAIRLVNFVECTFPLFRRDKLMEFMAVFDGSLVGWGVDTWYCDVLHTSHGARFAVVDAIQAINPHDWSKRGSYREIDRLQSTKERKAAWEEVRTKRGLRAYEHRTYWICAPTEAAGLAEPASQCRDYDRRRGAEALLELGWQRQELERRRAIGIGVFRRASGLLWRWLLPSEGPRHSLQRLIGKHRA